ncbi:hypothetical protein [Roseomonas indoligenes]|uniref:DUF2059 domain-containing protein n=1 Tax=Roseomonas indoligenes TaxID=2820811 RepID=A0A940MV36_9PROT|nr:hypothetical protein [Pararoseomonas indoligenes]MBP0492531.1 hypothetical protein [Pararoseomonas indoligenes]
MLRARPVALAFLAVAALATGAAAGSGKPDPVPPAAAGAAPSGKPAPTGDTSPAPGNSSASAPEGVRAAARENLRTGFIEGVFETFWDSFRESFVNSLVERGHDRAATERLADSTVLPIFQRNRPALEERLLDILTSTLTPEQLQDVVDRTRTGAHENVRAGISRADPAMEAAVEGWISEMMQANRPEITRGIEREGLRR